MPFFLHTPKELPNFFASHTHKPTLTMPTFVIKKDGAEFKATQVRVWRDAQCLCVALRPPSYMTHTPPIPPPTLRTQPCAAIWRGEACQRRVRGRRERAGRKPPIAEKKTLFFPQVDEGADATASGATLKELVAELTGGRGHSLSEVVPGVSAVLTVA